MWTYILLFPPEFSQSTSLLLPEQSWGRRNTRFQSSESLPWAVTLCHPLFIKLLGCGRRRRRFWVALRSEGVWEREFGGSFRAMGRRGFTDWEDNQYMLHLRFGKDAFWRLHAEYGEGLERENTHMRRAVSSEKRLAMTLHWLAHSLPVQQLALLYGVGKSTAVSIVHDTIEHLQTQLVPNAVKFPTSERALGQAMEEFEQLAGLPCCAGAIDGTFMKIIKPVHFGDTYWCYKKYPAIVILGTVDARGLFINVNVGNPGSAGDAASFQRSLLKRRLASRKWLNAPPQTINGVDVLPYLVADSAFALSTYITKCYSNQTLTDEQYTFNYRVIRTRRVVEQAFGRLKGRFRILAHNNLNDPRFASQVALVCCALHNKLETWASPFEPAWLTEPGIAHPGMNEQQNHQCYPGGEAMRTALAQYVHDTLPAVG